ncbi:MAG: hypothetical protein OEY85_01480 [Rhodospirillales bacterium]|nr:hypothetical protein [Rhodospirillales bacterium]
MTGSNLTFRGLTLRNVEVPLRRPLLTRIKTFETMAFLLIDLLTEEGITGHAYLFGYSPRGNANFISPLRQIEEMLKGAAVEPEALFDRARAGLSLMGHSGIAMMAISGFDMACWDAKAKAEGRPLFRLLGGEAGSIPAYNSTGLGIMAPDAAAEEALELLAEGGFGAVKIRLGRGTLEEDVAAVRAVRAAVGDDVALPSDFNQCLDLGEALKRCRALDGEGLYWIEEPIVYDDFGGMARIAAEIETPVQIGENFYGPGDMARAITAKAADYMMPDAERIGGVTGWLRAAVLAEAAGIPVSSHIFPEISAHLLAATPTRQWLEYVDWANPILAEPLAVENGSAVIAEVPGTGIAWNEAAVGRYAVDL